MRSVAGAALAAAVIGAGLLVGGAGCRQMRQDDVPRDQRRTASNMAEIERQLVEAKRLVQESMSALEQVRVASATDPRPAFASFVRAVDGVERQSRQIRADAQAMRASADRYYQTWQLELESVANPEVRQVAVERRQQSLQNFREINGAMQDVREAYDPFLSDLYDLETVLRNDLTAHGIEAVDPQFGNVHREAQELIARLDTAIDEIGQARRSLSPAAR